MTGRSMVAHQEGYRLGERAGRLIARDEIDRLRRALLAIQALIEGDWGVEQIREVVTAALSPQETASD